MDDKGVMRRVLTRTFQLSASSPPRQCRHFLWHVSCPSLLLKRVRFIFLVSKTRRAGESARSNMKSKGSRFGGGGGKGSLRCRQHTRHSTGVFQVEAVSCFYKTFAFPQNGYIKKRFESNSQGGAEDCQRLIRVALGSRVMTLGSEARTGRTEGLNY